MCQVGTEDRLPPSPSPSLGLSPLQLTSSREEILLVSGDRDKALMGPGRGCKFLLN